MADDNDTAPSSSPPLNLRHEPRAADADGYDPALLVGVSYASRENSGHVDGIVPASGPGRHLRFDASLLRSFDSPVSSRDGLVVVGPHEGNRETHVYDTLNDGHVISLLLDAGHGTPILSVDARGNKFVCLDVEANKWGKGGFYSPCLLTAGAGAAGRSFELLAMDVCLGGRRIFSSELGRWGPILLVQPPQEHNHWSIIKECTYQSPLAIGRTVYWVCRSTRDQPLPNDDVFILALHADDDAAQATAIDPPPGLRRRSMRSCALAITSDGRRLGLVVAETVAADDNDADAIFAETNVIAMWTLSREKEWSRQVVVDGQGIDKQVTPGIHTNRTIWIMGFGSRSGTVVFWLDRVGLSNSMW
ncbi:hypothetical protein HU200_058613 [Digitaria exilis]|uniref:DUF7595 domain-containing protein n=1 Tax=Digitaria exilis TaxID=1010633 RepID=A0A835E1Z0_9POAL|nr:hypothetical protein HU200_058613 [Digitaria exilis]